MLLQHRGIPGAGWDRAGLSPKAHLSVEAGVGSGAALGLGAPPGLEASRCIPQCSGGLRVATSTHRAIPALGPRLTSCSVPGPAGNKRSRDPSPWGCCQGGGGSWEQLHQGGPKGVLRTWVSPRAALGSSPAGPAVALGAGLKVLSLAQQGLVQWPGWLGTVTPAPLGGLAVVTDDLHCTTSPALLAPGAGAGPG